MSVEQTSMNQLITDNIDIWTSTVKTKSASGRGSSKKRELYGVKKLRELILELAFSGKLVKNDPQKVSLDSLLDEMNRERVEFHERKGVRLQKFKELPDTKLSFNLPDSWEVVAFNDVITYITDFQANGSFSTIKQNVQYFDNPDYAMLLRLTDLRHGLTDSSSYKYTDKKGYDFLSKSSVHGGELVVANVGAGVGTTLEVPQIEMPTTLAPNMFMVVLSKQVEKSYFLYFCQSLKYKQYIEMVNTGTGQPKINKTEYKNCQLPLPSLQEQNQVVAKINQLMTLCDQLEQQTEASIAAHQVLVTTLLDTLTNSANAAELMQNWQIVAEHFDTLFTTEASIDQLKQTILQLAVMGKLVPQDPTDEPAAKLLERIAEEKTQLIKGKKIKKQKALPPIVDDEKPFELPNGWEWCHLNSIISIMDAGWSPACPPEASPNNDTWGVLKTTAVQNMEYWEHENKVLASSKEPRPQYEVKKGDILITRAGPKNRVGVSCLAQETRPKLMISDKIIRFHLVEVGMSENYVSLCLNAGATAAHLESAKSGMAESQMNISQDKLKVAPVPLAPIKEQLKIISKVEELLEFCEQLKVRLRSFQTTQLHLTDAIVDQAV